MGFLYAGAISQFRLCNYFSQSLYLLVINIEDGRCRKIHKCGKRDQRVAHALSKYRTWQTEAFPMFLKENTANEAHKD